MLETMYYFGTLHRMSPRKVRERGQFLLKLLELPSAVCTTIKSLRQVYTVTGITKSASSFYYITIVVGSRGESHLQWQCYRNPHCLY